MAYDAKLFYDLSIIEVTRKLMELLDKVSRKESAQETSEIKEISSAEESSLNDGEVLVE